nr:DUF3551 domain-containing protein [Bradyrhizobium sp. Gha]
MNSRIFRRRAAMDAIGASIIAGATILAIAPASAQRYDPNYPVCLQRWEWGGSSTIYCSYASWQACKDAAVGLPAMCMVNPYWSQPGSAGPVRAPRGRAAPASTW